MFGQTNVLTPPNRPQVRSVSVCQGNISQVDIKKVQKGVVHIVQGVGHHSFKNALDLLTLENLYSGRNQLCIKFTKKFGKHIQFKH